MTETIHEPARAKVYKNAQGIEVEEESEQAKWTKRLAFYAVYYTFIYCLYLLSISIITGYTHSAGQIKPVSQARLSTPRMTMFPLDQIREIDWVPRSGVDNHLWYDSMVYDGKTMAEAFKEKLALKLANLKNQTFTTEVETFCAGDYKDFKNGKACFLVGVNTVVDWQPVKLVPDSAHSWFNAKLQNGNSKAFSLASQGLTDNAEADILFGCRVFDTTYDAANLISRPNSANQGRIMTNGIDWMHNENYLKNYSPFEGGVNPKVDGNAPTTNIYEKCVQPSYYSAECNINSYDYKDWDKPFTAVKIDMNAIDTEFQAAQPSDETVQHGYEFKCNAYAQNIITPMYDSESKLYFEGENGAPIVQSGGKGLHQNFIIQHET